MTRLVVWLLLWYLATPRSILTLPLRLLLAQPLPIGEGGEYSSCCCDDDVRCCTGEGCCDECG